MPVVRVVYDALSVIYALSLFLFFLDAIQSRRRVNRTALLLLFVVFVFETALLLLGLRSLGEVSMYSRFDSDMLISWLILLVALVVNTFFRIDLLLFFANVVGFAFVLFDAFTRRGRWIYGAHLRDLLLLHITLALISYVAFAFSFIFSIMYLIQDKFLREKRWNHWYFRLASLERLDLYTYRSILIGFPVLLIAMVLGTVWGKLVLGDISLLDPKLIATFALWIMYGLYLLLRLRSGWAGKNLVWYNVLCFSGVLLNFAVVGDFSAFHRTVV